MNKVDSGGIAAGADSLINDDLRVGAAFSYSTTNIDAAGVNNGNHDNVDSYQAMLYSALTGGSWYLNSNLSLANHQVDTSRSVNVGGIIDNPRASFDAWQYSAKVEGGLPFYINNVSTLIPIASLSYNRLNQDGYTEHSNSGAALSVSSRNTDSLRTGLGGKALFNLGNASDLKIQLEGRAMWLHEFADTTQDTTATFAAGGSAFTTKGVNIDRNAFNLGTSISLTNKAATQTLSISYDAEIKDQYLAHTGKVQARFDF